MNQAQQNGKLFPIKYNRPLLALAAGAASGVIKALITVTAKKLGLTTIDLVQVSAAILMKKEIHTFGEYLLGWIVVLLFGGIVGLIFYYSLSWLGQDFLLLKAVGAGLLFWLTDSTMAVYLGVPLIHFHKTFTHFTFFSSGIVYGIILSSLLRILALKAETKIR